MTASNSCPPSPDLQQLSPRIKCYRSSLDPSLHTTIHMESKPRLLLPTLHVSVAKWLPHLGSFSLLRGGHKTAALTPLPTSRPGSLRDAHDAACAWFLGPKAENANYFMMSVETILHDVIQCRRDFSPEDEVCTRLLGDSRRPYPSTLVGFH